MLNDEWLRPNNKNRRNDHWLNECEYVLQPYRTVDGKLIRGINKVPSEFLKSKKLLLFYFSASWCPPCKVFTPKLTQFYNLARSIPSIQDDFEIILLSFDDKINAFENYFKTMTWLSFPFEYSRENSEILVEENNLRGIPSLILVDPASKSISKSAQMYRSKFKVDVRSQIEECYDKMSKAKSRQEASFVVEDLFREWLN